MILLSVLIPALPKRYDEFMKLYHELQRQQTIQHLHHSSLGLVEILVDDTAAMLDGGISVGAKREKLRKRAAGKFLCYADSDDNVAPNYLEVLVRLLQEDPDIATFRCLFKNDHYWSLLNMSLENQTDEQANPDSIIQRRPWHVCPVRNEIAQKEHFDDISHGEDNGWINKILPHCTRQSHTDMILTQYNHSEQNSEADKILKAGYK